MNYLTESTEIILGIGQVFRREFEQYHIDTVQDLILMSPLSASKRPDISMGLKELNDFRSMALLMEINDVTPEMASILVKAKINSPSELRLKAPANLIALFQTNNYEITPEQVTALILDSYNLHYSGSISGTIEDKRGQPLPNLKISCGGIATTTDRNGRFRISRIRAANQYDLIVAAEGEVPVRYPEQRITQQNHIPHKLRLVYQSTPLKEEGYDEYNGETIPYMIEPKYKIVTMTTPLRPLDLLTVFDVKNDMVRLNSKYKSFQKGAVVIYRWNIPLSNFENRPIKGDHYKTDAFLQLTKTNSSNSLFLIKKATKQTVAEFRNRAKPETAMEKEMYLNNFKTALLNKLKK